MILDLIASFQVPEPGDRYSQPMPSVPDPDDLDSETFHGSGFDAPSDRDAVAAVADGPPPAPFGSAIQFWARSTEDVGRRRPRPRGGVPRVPGRPAHRNRPRRAGGDGTGRVDDHEPRPFALVPRSLVAVGVVAGRLPPGRDRRRAWARARHRALVRRPPRRVVHPGARCPSSKGVPMTTDGLRFGIHLPQFGRAAVAGAIERAARARGSARLRRRVGERPPRDPGGPVVPRAAPVRSADVARVRGGGRPRPSGSARACSSARSTRARSRSRTRWRASTS